MKSNLFKIFILLVIASFLVFYRYSQIPKYLSFDEVEFTKLALSLKNKPYISFSPLATGHSTLYFYLILSSFEVFGINTFALRLPSAIFGILSIISFYFVAKNVFKNINKSRFDFWFPFILSLILATTRWFIDFSRFGFEATLLLFVELTSIYCLIRYLDKIDDHKNKSKYPFLIFSGIFAGLAFNSYTPGRVFFILPLIILSLKLFNLRTSKQQFFKPIKQLLIFLIPLIIIITPLTTYLITNKDTRIDQLFFWKNSEMTLKQKATGTINNVSSIASMFVLKGDMNGRHNYPGKPALNPILFGLFFIGFIYSFKEFKNIWDKLFIFYFLLSILPSIPIYPWENPSMLRTFTTLPSIIYFVGQAIIILPTIVGKIIFRSKKWILPILFFLLFLSSLYELRTYFKYQAKVFESSFEIKYPLDVVIKLKNPYEKIN